MESSIPIEIKDFSKAILEGKPHPQMFLRFGRIPLQIGKKRVASSDITAAIRNDNGKCAFASWFYHIDQIAINLMFAEAGERREGLVNAWHPRFGTNRLRIFDF